MNFHEFLQIITSYHKSLKLSKKKKKKFSIKKFTKNYILKKNLKFNIKKFTKNYILLKKSKI